MIRKRNPTCAGSLLPINGSIVYLGIICLLLGCSRLEQSEREKVRRRNCVSEPIYRNRADRFYTLETPAHTPRSLYPWEAEANLPRITRDFFRCKGNPTNPALVSSQGDPLNDCEGGLHHGFPVIGGKETVYPILTDLLNYLQKKTGRRVVITCGHRCPTHNTYADPTPENRTSKHQIGAEVDFYVQGMEDRPLEIAGLLMQYFKETNHYRNDPEFLVFKPIEKSEAQIPPCGNKEILITVHEKGAGRDLDNHHPFPYLTLQVRYDRERKERVQYQWAKAHKIP